MSELQYIEIQISEGEHRNFFGRPIYEEIVHLLLRLGAPGITVFRSCEGLDTKGRLQNMNLEYMQESLPIILQIVTLQNDLTLDTVLKSLHGHPHCITVTQAGDATDVSTLGREVNDMSDTAILKIYMKEADHYEGVPLYHALILEGRKSHFLWVNMQRALEGFGPDRMIRKERVFRHANHAPVVVEITGNKADVLNFTEEHQALIKTASGPAIILGGDLVSGKV